MGIEHVTWRCLSVVFDAIVLSKLLYASSAWSHGFISVEHLNMIQKNFLQEQTNRVWLTNRIVPLHCLVCMIISYLDLCLLHYTLHRSSAPTFSWSIELRESVVIHTNWLNTNFRKLNAVVLLGLGLFLSMCRMRRPTLFVCLFNFHSMLIDVCVANVNVHVYRSHE